MSRKYPRVYAVRHKSEAIRAASRSGGMFTAVSDWVLEKNGVLYGCALDENCNAVHIRAENAFGRNRMRGSKYIQSRLGNAYASVKQDVLNGRLVLFSGTSCQIAGLKGYLGKEYDNLICVDIVCHGVPSPKVWQTYLRWQEGKYNSPVKEIDFRNKRDFGWRDHVETLTLENGRRINSRVYTRLLYGHCILRPSCYECPYKSVTHPGDITLADYWGVEKAAPELDDDKGISLVLLNSERGEYIFRVVENQVRWRETRLEDSMQKPLQASFPKPENREAFWIDYTVRPFGDVVKRYGSAKLVDRLRAGLRRWKRRVIR